MAAASWQLPPLATRFQLPNYRPTQRSNKSAGKAHGAEKTFPTRHFVIAAKVRVPRPIFALARLSRSCGLTSWSRRQADVRIVPAPGAALVIHPEIARRPVPPLAALVHQPPSVGIRIRVRSNLSGKRRSIDAALRYRPASAGVACTNVDTGAGRRARVHAHGCRGSW